MTTPGPGKVPSSASAPIETATADGWSSGTVRFRLPPKLRYGLRAAFVGSLLGVVLLAARADRSSDALAEYHNEYARVGGDFTFPSELDAAADRDQLALVALTLIALAIWSIVAVVWALGRTLLRLDEEGLWWRPSHGLRWRGPIARTDVVVFQPGARKRQVPSPWIPVPSLVGRLTDRLGIYDVAILYLRSETGSSIKHANYLDLPQQRPEAARSLIIVPEALFRANPAFLRRLRTWILP